MIIGLTVVLALTLVLFAYTLKFTPSWVKEDDSLSPVWTRLNIIGLIAAFLSSLITFFVYGEYQIEYQIVAALSASLLAFVLCQTSVTDFAKRLADRQLFRLANAITALAGVWFLWKYVNTVNLIIYVFLFLVMSIFLFIPKIGASDGRALQLVTLATFPVLGLEGFQYGFLLMGVILFVYAIIHAVHNKSFKDLLTKVSIPMVPIIVSPFLLMVLVMPLFK